MPYICYIKYYEKSSQQDQSHATEIVNISQIYESDS